MPQENNDVPLSPLTGAFGWCWVWGFAMTQREWA
jgi:hypothetical protein